MTFADLVCGFDFVDDTEGLQLGAGQSSASTELSRGSLNRAGGLSCWTPATPTTMLEQTPKSSRLSAYLRKLHVDIYVKSSMGWDMANEDEIDPTKVCTGLFALITARLEDAHESSVKGQSENAGAEQAVDYVSDIRSNLDEIHVQLAAIELIKNL